MANLGRPPVGSPSVERSNPKDPEERRKISHNVEGYRKSQGSIQNLSQFFYELTGKTVAKEEFASAMTEGSVGLPSPDLQVYHWIRLDQSGLDWIG